MCSVIMDLNYLKILRYFFLKEKNKQCFELKNLKTFAAKSKLAKIAEIDTSIFSQYFQNAAFPGRVNLGLLKEGLKGQNFYNLKERGALCAGCNSWLQS